MGKGGNHKNHKSTLANDAKLDEMRDTLRSDFGIVLGHHVKPGAIKALFDKAMANVESRSRRHHAADDDDDGDVAAADGAGAMPTVAGAAPLLPTAAMVTKDLLLVPNESSNASALPHDCWGVVLEFCTVQALFAACTACQQLRLLADQEHLFSRFFYQSARHHACNANDGGADTGYWWHPSCTLSPKPLGKRGIVMDCRFVARHTDHWVASAEDVDLQQLPWSQYWSLRLSLAKLERATAIQKANELERSAEEQHAYWKDCSERQWNCVYMQRWVFSQYLNTYSTYHEDIRFSADAKAAIAPLEKFNRFVFARSHLDLYHSVEEGSPLQQWAWIEANRHAGMACIAQLAADQFDFCSVSLADAERYHVPVGAAAIGRYITLLREGSLDSHFEREHDVVGDESYGFSKIKSRDYQEVVPHLAAGAAAALEGAEDLGASTCGGRTMRKRHKARQKKKQGGNR